MPRYFFNVKDGQKIIRDPDGTELPDEDSAYAHAYQVVRELTRNREHRTRSWRLAVHDEQGEECFELLFASVDDTVAQLPAEMRALVEKACRNTASLNDEINQARMTLRVLMGTMARFEKVPYLAAVDRDQF